MTTNTKIPALNYALVKLHHQYGYLGLTSEPIVKTAAIGLYLHFKNQPDTSYQDIVPHLRQFPLNHNYFDALHESQFHEVQKIFSDLNDEQSITRNMLIDLTKDGKCQEWNDVSPATPEEFIKAMDSTYTDKDATYFGFVQQGYKREIESMNVSENIDDKREKMETDIARNVITTTLSGDMYDDRAKHYFTLMAYQSQDQQVEISHDIANVHEYAERREQKRLKDAQKKRSKTTRQIVAAFAVTAALIGYHKCSKDHGDVSNKDWDFVRPPEQTSPFLPKQAKQYEHNVAVYQP